MLNSENSLAKWQLKAITELQNSNITIPILLIINNDNEIRLGLFNKIKQYPYSIFLYRFWKRFFWKFKTIDLVELPEFLKKTNSIKVEPIKKGKFSEYFDDETIELIKKEEPDFIIRFGFNILKGEILTVAKYGVWSYHHSDPFMFRGGPPVFWEIFRNKKYVGAILQKLTEKIDGGIILKQGKFPAINHGYIENFDLVYYNSSYWITQVCLDILNEKADYFESEACNSKEVMNKYPKNHIAFLFILKLLYNKIKFHLKELFLHEFWVVGIAKCNINNILHDDFLKNTAINTIKHNKKNHYYADSFIEEENDNLNLYVEDYNYKIEKGSIVKLQLNKSSLHTINNTDIISEDNSHFSFPFLFKQNGFEYYLPENYQKEKTILYIKEGNIYKSYSEILSNKGAIDPVLFFYKNKFWLFCTHKDSGSNMQLFIYFSDSLENEFSGHPLNPVKIDISSSRPAGKIFELKDKIYRLSQDCAKTYGEGVVLTEIIELSETSYSEKYVKTIYSPLKSYSKGFHTLDFTENYVVFDAKRYGFSYYRFKNYLKNKLFK